MKKILVGATALVVGTMSAQAADLARKAPVYKAPVAQVYDWTGFYLGANFGGSIGRDRTRSTINNGAFSNEQSHLSPAGAIGGGQIGYNWQFRNFYNLVLGVEADIQASGQKDSHTCLLNCLRPGQFQTFDQKIDWFGTARVRAGIATGPVLTYVTGGYAYGNVNTSSIATAGGFTATQSVDNTRGGYVLGSGVEAQLGGNWTGKIEYLYLNLGTQRAAGLIGGVPFSASSKIEDHIFRAGVNYRIGGNAAYTAPLANWAGVYVGGNFGSVIARDRSSLRNVAFANAATFSLVPEGFVGGGQIGYNWQAGAWVFGAEADFQGSSAKDNKACVFGCVAGAAVTLNQKLPWLGTVRGRVGYSVGSTLFYGTAGFAYGETKTSFGLSNGLLIGAAEIKRSKGGYAVGGGIESPFNPFNLFGPNWTSKTEYLYVDLGRSTNTFTSAGATLVFSTKTEEHLFRTGINYHFNAPAAPVVAKY